MPSTQAKYRHTIYHAPIRVVLKIASQVLHQQRQNSAGVLVNGRTTLTYRYDYNARLHNIDDTLTSDSLPCRVGV